MALTFLQKLNIFGRYKVEQPINVLTTAQYTQRNNKLLKKDFVEWYKTNPFVFWAIQERAKAVSNVKLLHSVHARSKGLGTSVKTQKAKE